VRPLLAVVVALVVGACGGPAASSTPGETEAPSPSTAAVTPSAQPSIEPSTQTSIPLPTPTTGPSPTASTYVQFAEFAFVNKFVMRVAVSELNVRRAPSKSGTSEGKAPKGALFMMYDWPVSADGYTWYYGFTLLTSKPGVLPDLPTPIETGYDEVLGGWMATGTEDTPFLVPLAPRCPSARDLANVAAMLDSERLSCFGSTAITLEGTFGCMECGGATAGTYEPAWLAGPLDGEPLAASGVELVIRFAPDGPTPPARGAHVRVHGHFSDARSTGCRIQVLIDDSDVLTAVDNDAAAQWCRSQFVVDSFEVTD
jgi:hypothetical protein